jgi:hypothetical protein
VGAVVTAAAPRLIAVSYDAADPRVVRALLERGELPTLNGLVEAGAWTDVRSDATTGPIAPWPNFIVGGDFRRHEISSLWRWDAERMTLTDHPDTLLEPFWRQADHAWGVVDVPLAPPAPRERAGQFEIANWWTPQLRPRRTAARPRRVGARLPRHPLRGHVPQRPLSGAEELALARRCCDAVAVRGRALATVLGASRPEAVLAPFYEIHWAGHRLGAEACTAILRAADAELGRLLAAHPQARVCIFSLYGMEARRGVATVLGPLLDQLGYARPQAAPALARASSSLPRAARPALRGLVPVRARHRAWRARMQPACDWGATAAFALPTEQQGLVRINLAGREAAGVVPAGAYASMCEEVASALGAARDAEGRPLVAAVHATARHFDGAPPAAAPDLVVEWTEAAHADEVRLPGRDEAVPLAYPWLTAQHAFDGFCVTAGAPAPAATLAPGDLGGHLTAMLAA